MSKPQNQWKKIDLSNDGDAFTDIDLNEVAIPPSSDPDGDAIPPGRSIAVVKTEEVWLVDDETGEVETQIASNSYIKYLDKEKSAFLIAQIEAQGATLAALQEYFL